MNRKAKSVLAYFLLLQIVILPLTIASTIWVDRLALQYHGVCLKERRCLSEKEFKIRALTSAMISHAYLFEGLLEGVNMKNMTDIQRAAKRVIEEGAISVSLSQLRWASGRISRFVKRSMTNIVAVRIYKKDWPRPDFPSGIAWSGYRELRYVFDNCGYIKLIDYGGHLVDERCLSVLGKNQCLPPTAKMCPAGTCW